MKIEPNLTAKKETAEWCDAFQHICKASYRTIIKLPSHRERSIWIFNIFWHIYIYRTPTIRNTNTLEPSFKRSPCTDHAKGKLTQICNRSLKLYKIWFILVLLLPTQHQVSGHGISRQTSNSKAVFSYRHPNENLKVWQLQNFENEAKRLKTNQIHPRIRAKSTPETGLNILSKSISKESRDSIYNASSNKYSLINVSQSKNLSLLSNKKLAVEGINIVPIQSRQTRETTDIDLKTKGHIKQTTKIDEAKLKRLVLKGLGIKKLPDMRKVNISQVEYSSKYVEYLSRLRNNQKKGNSYFNNFMGASHLRDIHFLSITTNEFNDISNKRSRHRRSLKKMDRLRQTKKHKHYKEVLHGEQDTTNILLHFPLTNAKEANFHNDKIDEANIRLMLLYSSSLATNFRRGQGSRKKKVSHNDQIERHCNSGDVNLNQSKKIRSQQLNLKVYQLVSANRRRKISSRKFEFENVGYEETRTQWIEFDVTKAVRSWLNKSHDHLGIEIQCYKCKSIGARILSDFSPSSSPNSAASNNEHLNIMPVLNIIGHGTLNSQEHGDSDVHHIILTNNRSDQYVHHRSDHDSTWRKDKWSNNCYKLHQRCCRNQLNVAFKNIKGFEFILQPKVFDAGYCHGRCPPRHNPAHHHALLQSLIWQEDHNRAPRPCCAPSKLEMLEILHVDEDHSDKLKISTWSDMQVVECACS
ncbi:uncharacterized protein LOC6555854 isoform X1 [Drosophila erecta]|uniref:TGF-beta family profile domain-containing protein n=1 Tax=Drosophila erecta TaxID=7220 RepID=B3P9S3_DROER|nr:uncharacterized protein LOC6555854 isoform X1 [Drosophila erecta]EDV45236.1 uncharacterized protein Dere_GG16441 [Drosophila erecta]